MSDEIRIYDNRVRVDLLKFAEKYVRVFLLIYSSEGGSRVYMLYELCYVMLCYHPANSSLTKHFLTAVFKK